MSKSNKTIINVQNIGPIRSAKFDLRPLTVFTGKNNTGKSWLATIVYALFSYSSSKTYRAFLRNRDHKLIKKNNLTKLAKTPERWIMKLEDEGIIELNDEEMDIFSKKIDANGHAEVIKSEIFRCSRSAKQGQIVRSNSNTESSILVQNYREGLLYPPNQFSLDISKSSVEYKIPLRNVISLKEPESRFYSRILRALFSIGGGDGGHKSRSYLFFELLNLLDSQNLLTSGMALYLPAERMGLANNYRTFVSSALQESIDSSLLQASGVNLDFVKKLLDIPDTEDRRQRSQEAISMEKNLIKGKITVERDSFNIPQFSYVSEELSKKLPLNMTSSMVSQIAPVVLFLRYYGNSHRVLIVEEPEAHLHPENQVKFTQEICSWVRRGYKVLLTTHSEWIIEELSNQALANEVQSSPRLDSSNVGVWEVLGSKNGSTLREIRWKPEEAGYDDGYDRVADKLSNRWFEYHEMLE